MKINNKIMNREQTAVSAVIGVILMVAITVAIAATVYYYVLPMMSSPEEMPPELLWDVSQEGKSITLTQGDDAFAWAESSDKANLYFVCTSNQSICYVKNDYTINYAQTNLLLGAINTGITITGFEGGQTYEVVWGPLSYSLGSLVFNQ